MCCGLQIRPVEEQLKQRVIGGRYCISRKKGSHTKEVLAVLGLQSVCQMSRKKREVFFPERSSSAKGRRICLGWMSPSLGYGRICPHSNMIS